MVIMNSGSTAGVVVNGTVNKTNEECGIKEVYASNLNEEFDQIRRIVDKFQFIAMDTEFPGVVARPIGEFKSTADYQYQLLRCNVDLLKLIQVGLTFLNEKGEMPTKFTTWQFNFKFSLGEDMYAQDSIDLLTNSGIKFKKHEEDGIDFMDFAELLMTSGLVLSEKVKWISFHSGYDFGYLLKLLTNFQLPADENEFFELLQIYFPAIYDVKYVMKSCRSLKGGLQEVADQLKVDRIGPQHQAGSDSLLTGLTFFRMKQLFFEDSLDDGLYCGHLFGLGAPYGNGADAAAPPVPVLDVGQKMQQVNGTTPTTATGSQSNGVASSSAAAAVDQSASSSAAVAAATAAAAALFAAATKGAGPSASAAANGIEASGQKSSDGGQTATGGQATNNTQPLETMSSSSGGTSRLSVTNTKSSSSTSSSGGGGGGNTTTPATNQNYQQQQSATNHCSVNVNNNSNNNQSVNLMFNSSGNNGGNHGGNNSSQQQQQQNVNPNDKDEATTSSLSTNSGGNSQDSTDSASETSSNHGGGHSNDAES